MATTDSFHRVPGPDRDQDLTVWPGTVETARTGTSPADVQFRLKAASLPRPVLVYLLCIAVPLGFSAGPLAMTTLRLFLLVMVVPLMIRILMGHYGRIIAADILFPLHILWAAVALGVNNPDRMVQQVGSVGIEFIGGYVIARAYIRTPQDFFALCRAFVLLLICLFPFSIFEALTNRMPPLDLLDKLPFFNSTLRATSDVRLGLYRVQSILNHPIHFGMLCSIVLSFCFIGMKGLVSTTRRYLSTLIVCINGFLALSSGAFLAMLLQVALISWDLALAKVRMRWWILLGLFALGYVVIDLLSNRTPVQVFMSYATFSPHTAYWRGLIFEFGMENVWANPLFGLGLNEWTRPDWMHTSSVDNFWLLMAMRYGIPGFLLLALGCVLSTLALMRRDFSGEVLLAQFRTAWLFSFFGLGFTLATVHVWNNAYSLVFFMFGSGMWLLTAATVRADGRDGVPAIEAGGPKVDSADGEANPYTRFATNPPREIFRSHPIDPTSVRPSPVSPAYGRARSDPPDSVRKPLPFNRPRKAGSG